MDSGLRGRTLRALVLLASALQFTRADYTVPDVTFKVLKPKGLEVSIPDSPGITFFAFNGHKNRQISQDTAGSIKGEVLRASGGRWAFTDPDIQLKSGDVINFYVFVTYNSLGYLKEGLSYTVPATDSGHVTPPTSPSCQESVTKLRGTKACSGQVIFEDHFNELRNDLWQVEQYIPMFNPDYPFVSYQRNEVVSVSGGYLHIKPKLQQTMPGYSNESIILGTLDLYSGCTAGAEACYLQVSGPTILPPVASGRLTSTSFAFKYGTVHIKAKLPQGDWIYPEILLEPFLMKYGKSTYASGLIKIASARGNKELRKEADEYSNKVLYGGPVMDFQCRHDLIRNKFLPDGLWGDDFHEFSVTWKPDSITLSVDGTEWLSVDARTPLRDRFPARRCPQVPHSLLARGSNLAPFDDFFSLTLGVAVGGISEFPDNCYTTGGKEKPWKNTARKAMIHFWEDLDSWLPTWTGAELLVDYVKVVAL